MAPKKPESAIVSTTFIHNNLPEATDQVTKAVDGCVVDWTTKVQVNPQTGQTFDFSGNLIGG